MAKPRIFISSTFYDLRHVRGEIERFIRDIGYEPVLNERGHITYGSVEALEKYCYKEIEKISILVSVIGGRFGATARGTENYSISNMELKAAIEQGKQIYVFVENGVLSEYRTFLKNKDKDIQYHHVDDPRIYAFLEEIYGLPVNNQIQGFDNIPQVVSYLKEQWAGLLEVYLAQQSQEKIFQLTETIKSTAETLKGLVELLKEEKLGLQSGIESRQGAIDAIILQNHPLFSRLQKICNAPYRVFFTNIDEMESWLKARQFTLLDRSAWDSPLEREYMYDSESNRRLLKIRGSLFDDKSALRPILPAEWSNDMVSSVRLRTPPRNAGAATVDDDIPF